MTERKTIRPVTLRRILETSSMAIKEHRLSTTIMSKELKVSLSRAKEILLELATIGLLSQNENDFSPTVNTEKFLEYFENEKWNMIHEYFLANYRFYRDYIQILNANIDEKGLTLREIRNISVNEKLSLNQTAVEVLSDWCERLGVIQKHLFARRIYVTKILGVDDKYFKKSLLKYYRDFSVSSRHRGIFVEIPILREDLCERLKITRTLFDEMLRDIFLENVGKIELSGAPITTLAKKSPLGEKKMKLERRDIILSSKLESTKEREGLLVNRKSYYYLAIHDSI